MYLRETKRRNADGTVVRSYQLAENTWDSAKGSAVARIVYNFGRADGIDGDKLRRLARSILRVFAGEDGVGVAPESAEPIALRDSWPRSRGRASRPTRSAS